MNRGGKDSHVDVVADVFRPLANVDGRALAGEFFGILRGDDVGSGHIKSLIDGDKREPAHAAAANADKINFLDRAAKFFF